MRIVYLYFKVCFVQLFIPHSFFSFEHSRLALCGEDYELFWKKVQFTVDKDVVRTDRSNPYYAGQDNPNVQKMRFDLNYLYDVSLIYLNYDFHDALACLFTLDGLMI